MTAQPILSVVVCTHDRPDDLTRCLEALVALEDPVEVIVVDSASTPPVEPVVAPFAGAGAVARLRYVREDEPGLSAARNAGLDAATTDIVAFVDDDAAPRPDWARVIASCFAEPSVACVGGSCLPRFDAAPPPWISQRLLALAGITDFAGETHDVESTAEYPFGANIAFRRHALLAAGAFDPTLGRIGTTLLSGEETAVVARLLTQGYTTRICPAAVVDHTVHRERMEPGYYRRRLYWQGVTRARMSSRLRRSGGLAIEVLHYAFAWAKTRDRYYLYRIGPETAGHLAEWAGHAR